MAFIETPRFPDDLRFGFSGGPEFSTSIVEVLSGGEKRNRNWAQAKGRWQGTHGPHGRAETDSLIAYFRAAGGRLNGFRFKDWTDYKCALANGAVGSGAGSGAPVLQINKTYLTGTESDLRPIRKPVASTVEVWKNGVKMTSGYTLDPATGLVSFAASTTKSINANSAKAITAITQANPGVVTAVGHGYVTGDRIKITDVAGMTQVNGLYYTVTWISADAFSIGVNTTAYTAYVSGGTATKYGITQTSPARVYSTAHGFSNGQIVHLSSATGMTEVNGRTFTVANASADYFDLFAENASAYSAYSGNGVIGLYPQPSDTLAWLGDFDVPARFSSDRLEITLVAHGLYSWEAVEIMEIRA
ncbi:DUF2460 domain-containing protein [Malikia spinosa]|uniref:DUF2460 domain-containing protein n=1 Tax=Malikia spinosa TaxID=86180 RepID=UPI002FDA19D3